jgi:hypothetical protein
VLAALVGPAAGFTAGVHRQPPATLAQKRLLRAAPWSVPYHVLFASEEPELPFAVTRVSGSEVRARSFSSVVFV